MFPWKESSRRLWVVSLITLVYAACVLAAAGYLYYKKKSKSSLIMGIVTALVLPPALFTRARYSARERISIVPLGQVLMGADIATFIHPKEVAAWGALFIVTVLTFGGALACFKHLSGV